MPSLARKIAQLSAVVALAGACRAQAPPDQEDLPVQLLLGTAPAAARGVPTVVLLRPQEVTGRSMRRDTLVMDQFGMAFSPGLLVLERGQTVRFQNSEDVVHNVQVRWLDRDSTLFNAGTAQGSPFHFTFEETGSYDVYCDIHPGMTAMLLVHDAAMVVTAARDGSFRLEDIPPGSYSVEVWSADPRLRGRRSVVVGVGRTELDLRDR